jgi:hypothetical protein
MPDVILIITIIILCIFGCVFLMDKTSRPKFIRIICIAMSLLAWMIASLSVPKNYVNYRPHIINDKYDGTYAIIKIEDDIINVTKQIGINISSNDVIKVGKYKVFHNGIIWVTLIDSISYDVIKTEQNEREKRK